MIRRRMQQPAIWPVVEPTRDDGQRWRRLPNPLRASLLSLALAAVLATLLLGLRDQVGIADIALLFLLPVLTAAALGGLVSGVLAAVICTLAFDLFFIKPYGTLTVASAQDVLTLILYLGVGALVAELSGHARARFQEADRRAAINALLYDLSSALVAGDLETLLHTLVARLGETFALRSCAILLPDAHGALHSRAAWGAPPAEAERDAQVRAAAQWAATQGKPLQLTLGRGEHTLQTAADGGAGAAAGSIEEPVLLLPFHLGATEARAGVLALTRSGSAVAGEEEIRLLSSFAAQAGLAVDRARLAEESTAAAVLRESDRAKSALLANVSHDLRTPLTTIRGAAESLLQEDLAFDAPTRQELLASIRDESDRLAALVGNLLNLSRLEAGALQLDRHLYDLAEIAGRVIARMRPHLADHGIHTACASGMPLVWVDYTLIEQVLVNLLDNAAKFAPAGTDIAICVSHVDDQVLLSVRDHGPGVPRVAREQVFQRFYRAPGPATRRVPGTGLGLAICHAVVTAHGGRIWIDAADTGGTIVRIALPAHAGAGAAGQMRLPEVTA